MDTSVRSNFASLIHSGVLRTSFATFRHVFHVEERPILNIFSLAIDCMYITSLSVLPTHIFREKEFWNFSILKNCLQGD